MALYIGVMSGTSMDAVDCALVDLSTQAPQLLVDHSVPWPPVLRERLQTAAAGSPLSATDFGRLDSAVGQFIADAVNALLQKAGRRPGDISAIGSHGQTIAHAPDGDAPATVQLGDANVIAERTGITTISDFRRRDIAAGGQGAPLAPAFHAAVLRHTNEERVVLNLGGIANLTVLPADPHTPVTGFDTGPANCLMDQWTRQHRGMPHDRDGQWALSAEPSPELLARLLDDPYFELPPPKSTGTQYFSRHWLQQRLADFGALPPDRVQATLLALTLRSITDAIARHAPQCQRVLACGGGVNNQGLLAGLATQLQRPVESTAEHGIEPQWMEPMAFAWLASQTLRGQALTLGPITGASAPRVLGAIYHR